MTEKPFPAADESDYTGKLLPHEKLAEAIDKIKNTKIFSTVPLDSMDIPLYVYGENFQAHEKSIEEFYHTLKKGHTLTRKDILSRRQLYVSESFFVTDDGFYEDPQLPCARLLNLMQAYIVCVTPLACSVTKSPTANHNLRLADLITSDMLVFVESLQSEQSIVSTYSERNSRRRSIRHLENYPQGS